MTPNQWDEVIAYICAIGLLIYFIIALSGGFTA